MAENKELALTPEQLTLLQKVAAATTGKTKIRVSPKFVLLVVVYIVILFGSSVRQLVGGHVDWSYIASAEYWFALMSDTATNLVVLFVMFVYALDIKKGKNQRYQYQKQKLETELVAELDSNTFDPFMDYLNDERGKRKRVPISPTFVTNGYEPKQKANENYDPYKTEGAFVKFVRDMWPRILFTIVMSLVLRSVILQAAEEAIDFLTAVVAIVYALLPLLSNAYIGWTYADQWLLEKTMVDLQKREDIWSLYKTYKKNPPKAKEVSEPCTKMTNTDSPQTTTPNLSKSTSDLLIRPFDNNVVLPLVK